MQISFNSNEIRSLIREEEAPNAKMMLLRRLLVFVFIFLTHISESLKHPDYDSGWMELWTDTSSNVTNKIVLHGLLETPLLVDVQVKENDTGTIYPATGHIIQNKDLRSNGSQISESKCSSASCISIEPKGENGVMYVYNHRVVKVIAKTGNIHKNYGRCTYTEDVPGGLMMKVRIRAWKSSSLPLPAFTWSKALSLVGEDILTEFKHGLNTYPELVISRVRYAFTQCIPFQNTYSDSIGAPFRRPSDSQEKTGYVMYEYDTQSIFIRSAPEILVANDGIGGGETVIKRGIVEVYVWNSSDIQASTENISEHFDTVSIPNVPGMRFDDTTKFIELLKTTVQSMDLVINKSVHVSTLIDKGMTLKQFLNASLTVGELLNTTQVDGLIRSEENTTIQQIIDMIGMIGKVLNGEMHLVQMLDSNMYLTHIINNSLPISALLNGTLTAQVPFNDSFLINKFKDFLENSTTLIQVVNSSLLVKDSFQNFKVFNESYVLENIIKEDSLLLQYRQILKSIKDLKPIINDLEASVNYVNESSNYLNISLMSEPESSLDGSKYSEETTQQLEYLKDVQRNIETIENMAIKIAESVGRLDSVNLSLAKMTNETFKLTGMKNTSLSAFLNISNLLDLMAGFDSYITSLPEFAALNEAFVASNLLSGKLGTELEKMLTKTNNFTTTTTERMKRDLKQYTILELISKNIYLGDLLNASISLKDVLVSSVTLQDLEISEKKVWSYLDENLKVSDIVNNHSKSIKLIDVLIESVDAPTQSLSPYMFVPDMRRNTDNYMIRGLLQSNGSKNMTTASGLLLWYRHMIIPVYCNLGGMMYGFIAGGVKIWYSNWYPECSAMCKDKSEKEDGISTQLYIHYHPKFISKKWTIDADYCASHPCKHGGKCTNSKNSYKCACADGWSGNTCDNNIDECIGKCKYSVECIDKINDYKCVCKPGWSGKNCSSVAKPFKVLPIKNTRTEQESEESNSEKGIIGHNSVGGNLVIIGTSDLDITSFSTIKYRHMCTKYFIDVKRLGSSNNVSLTIERISNTCFSHCLIYWGDGFSNTLLFTLKNTAIHTYQDGVYDITTTCITNDNRHMHCPELKSCMPWKSFLDDTYKTFAKPKQVMADQTIEINSYDDINKTCVGARYNWRILHANGREIVPYNDFEQSRSGRLTIDGGTLAPGIHVIILEVLLRDFWFNDFIVLNVSFQALYTFIHGGDFLRVPHGKLVAINASESRDTSDVLGISDHSELVVSWTFGLVPKDGKSDLEIYDMIDKNLSAISETFKVESGNINVLEVTTSYFPVNTYAVVVFNMTKGKRSSTAIQVLNFVDNPLPASISCIFNCNPSNHGLINFDKLTLDTEVKPTTATRHIVYKWDVHTLINNTFVPVTKMISDRGKPSLTIPKSAVKEGQTYFFEVKITTADNKLTNILFVKRTFDYVPHGGTCGIFRDNGQNVFEVISSSDLVHLQCKSWRTRSLRSITNGANPSLTYTVIQHTEGAFIEEEPITQRSEQEFFIVLKVGNPDKDYKTSIKIRIADVYNNYYETTISNIVSRPVLNVDDVDTTQQGADLVRGFIKDIYLVNLNFIQSVIKSPAAPVFYITAVCSNLYLTKISEKEPVVQPVLSDAEDGVFLDLTNDGDSTVPNFQDALKDSLSTTINPTIVTLRELYNDMTNLVVDISTKLAKYPDEVIDTETFSVVTNAFSNLAARAQFLDKDTLATLLDSLDRIGSSNTNVEDQGKMQDAADQTFKMAMSVSSATVSRVLSQYTPTDNIYSAMRQIDEMLSVFVNDFDIFNAAISPQERAMLYLKTQRKFLLSIDDLKEKARQAANSTVRLLTDVQDRIKQCQQCDNNASDSAKQLLKNTDACKLKDEMSRTKDYSFKLDGIDVYENKSCDQAKPVSVSAFEFKDNVYSYDNDGTSSLITSKVLRLDVKTLGKRVTAGYITFEQSIINPTPKHIVPNFHDEDVSHFMYHRFMYQTITESVCVVVQPLGIQDIQSYIIYIKFSAPPSIIDYDIKFYVYNDTQWKTCIDPHRMKGHSGLTYLAIGLKEKNEMLDYNITIVTLSCLAWEEEEKRWSHDKCQLIDWLYQEEKIVCHCRGVKEMIFGNSFFIAPNSIDFSTVFLKFSPQRQAAVLGTLAGIFIIYFTSLIFLAKLDKKDKTKWGITPLRDNYITDEYFYVIKVWTGMRRGAGTRSQIAFHLSGELDVTGYRELFDGIREEFSTGSIMTFIMSTPEDLGELHSLRIWHDNSGEGSFASWYINQIDFYDLKRRKTYSFPFETLLSVETGLEAISTSIPTNQTLDLESRFFGNLRQTISEGHLFISIIYRPSMSVFTRIQRASCALVFIMLNVLANALYFNPEPNYQLPAVIQIGPFRFTSQQLYVSVFSALFTTVPIYLLVQLFKRTKRKNPEIAENTSCSCLPLRRRSSCGARYRYQSNGKSQNEGMCNDVPILIDESQFENTLRLPSWFIYPAWLLVAGGIITPAFFVLLYSMEWGKQKSEEWLTTLTLSIIESIFLIDPLFVICVSFLLAVTCRSRTMTMKSSIAETISQYRQSLGDKENTVSSTFTVMKSIVTEFNSYKRKPRNVSLPIQDDNLKEAKENQRHYRSFQNSLKDIKLNIVCVLLVCFLCYSNRDDRSFLHHSQIGNRLVRPRATQTFNSIKTSNDLYDWINKTMLPYLFREHDKDGVLLHWKDRQLTKDFHLRLGPPRLRQLRIKNGTCYIPYIGRVPCFGEYHLWSEEDSMYCIGWTNGPCDIAQSVYNSSYPAWAFTSSFDIWGVPLTGYYTTYGGGGYIATLDIDLNYSIAIVNELYKNFWIDRQTRAVIVEFTLYDASTNLFIYNMFMVEFPQTGGAFTTYNTYPVRVYQHHGATGTWILVCEVLFVFYLLCLFIKICVRIYSQRLEFFRKFWTIYELVILFVSVTAIGLFFLRLSFALDTIKRFQKDNKMFVNFSHIVVWDQLLVLALGVLAFLSTIRMLEVLSTMKHLKAVVYIFKNCGKDLFYYGLLFIHIFIGFCALALLLFASKLESYRNIYQCMGTLFISMIGKSRFTEINETQPVLAKIFFILYVMVVVFFFLTIFLSILGASIDKVVHHNRNNQELDIIAYMGKEMKDILQYLAPIKKKSKKTVKFARFLPPKTNK